MNTYLKLTSFFISSFFIQNAIADQPIPLKDYVQATSPDFNRKVLINDIKYPHAIFIADQQLWISERSGDISRLDLKTNKLIATFKIPNVTFTEKGQDGLLGLAFDPKFNKYNHRYIYVSLSIKNPNATDAKFPNQTVIRRYTYNQKTNTLTDEKTLIQGLPSSQDHQAQRLVIGPDQKLYLSIGDQGSNQFSYLTTPNLAQEIPSKLDIRAKNYQKYAGKILRLNLDGSIPRDNPHFNGVTSHIYTVGHRNPQGLSFTPKGVLLESEQGPNTDDEINVIVKGGNYGWPYVAGYQDDSGYAFADYSKYKGDQSALKDLGQNGLRVVPGVPVYQESSWTINNFIKPLKTLFTVPNDHNFNDTACGSMQYICWPTVAASSAYFYRGGKNAIPGWKNVLLVPSLKRGVVFKVQLDDKTHTVSKDSSEVLFRGQDRYRDVAASVDGSTIYVLTDNSGNVQADSGEGTSDLKHPGAVIEFKYAASK